MIKNKKVIETLELCCLAIKAIHPVLNPDEPCIAFEAFEAAHSLIQELKTLPEEGHNEHPKGT